MKTMRIQTWQPGPEYLARRLSDTEDTDEDDDEDHLFAACVAAAGVLALFVVLTVASAIILAVRLLTYWMAEA
jgi:hypothetical protein